MFDIGIWIGLAGILFTFIFWVVQPKKVRRFLNFKNKENDEIKIYYDAEIINILNKAMDGDDQAEYEYGRLFFNGEKIPKDYNRGLMWLNKSADKNNLNAINLIGICFLNGWGGPVNEEEAFNYFSRAAEQGHAWAQYNLGLCYCWGGGKRSDFKLARYWLEKASDNEIIEANDLLWDLNQDELGY